MSKEFSMFLKDELKRRRISQRGGALYAGIGSTTIHYIINNPESNPRPETINSIADGWHLPRRQLYELAGYLLKESANPPSPEATRIMQLLREFNADQRGTVLAFSEFLARWWDDRWPEDRE